MNLRRQFLKNFLKNNKKDFFSSIELLKEIPSVKFKNTVETVDISIKVNIEILKNDNYRGFSILPNGTGKVRKVGVFAKDVVNYNKYLENGAGVVGFLDLIDNIKADSNNYLNYDFFIATPDIMIDISKIGSVLGPSGLMPNIKMGTVVNNVLLGINDAKYNLINYKLTKQGLLSFSIGKINYDNVKLKDNLELVLSNIKRDNKNIRNCISSIYISSTMGAGISLDLNSLTF